MGFGRFSLYLVAIVSQPSAFVVTVRGWPSENPFALDVTEDARPVRINTSLVPLYGNVVQAVY